MAILEKKHSSDALDFNIKDCQKVIEIYQKANNTFVIEDSKISEMLYQFRLAFGNYKLLEIEKEAPSKQQLWQQHQDIRTKSSKLLNDLQEKTDSHFLNGLLSALTNNESPYDLDDEEYMRLMKDVYQKLNNLGTSLKWLIDSLESCVSDNFLYSQINQNPKQKRPAINHFICNLSNILTMLFGEGGYYVDHHKNEFLGWKIDCIEYLLNHVGVHHKRGQIFSILNTSNLRKSANKSSK